jgi:hypothetical protein
LFFFASYCNVGPSPKQTKKGGEQMEKTAEEQKIINNTLTLLNKAKIKQLRVIYLVAYEIIKKS